MKITFFSTQSYDRQFFTVHNSRYKFDLLFLDEKLNEHTAALIQDSPVVCVFVNDTVNARVMKLLSDNSIKLIALRCAGFNNVDLTAAAQHGIQVVRVPAYSPHAVAEHALAMVMTLNRKTHKAYNRVREQNFALGGLLGFDLYKKKVGVIGTGNIGEIFCHIMKGLDCEVIAFDPNPNENVKEMGIQYVSLSELLPQCDIISLHCPLNSHTQHLINTDAINQMKDGVMLINTSRGGLLDTPATVEGLKNGKIGSLGIDVYEQEEKLFFQNLSETIIHDDVIARLMSFPNVLITAHQGFFTKEALDQIAETTLANIQQFVLTKPLTNIVTQN